MKAWVVGTVFFIVISGISITKSTNIKNNQTIDNLKGSIKKTSEINSSYNDWYYLPSYPDYAPNGVPDFDEVQQDSWLRYDGWPLFCGACAVANVFWWFDSKHENLSDNLSGFPGDGEDSYPLVQDYNAPPPPNPGPYSDDHNFNNVNDNRTPFNKMRRSGELIERIAWYTTRILFFNFTYITPILSGFGDLLSVIFGTKRFIKDAGLKNDYKVQFIARPSFSDINTYIRKDYGVILVIGNWNPDHKPFPDFSWGHYVAVAGINSNGQIALSDSIRDDVNPSLNPIEHNDAMIVSHDIWNVSFDSLPAPLISSWWLPDYYPQGHVIVHGAIIISENEKP